MIPIPSNSKGRLYIVRSTSKHDPFYEIIENYWTSDGWRSRLTDGRYRTYLEAQRALRAKFVIKEQH